MRKFLDKLQQSGELYHDMPTNTEAERLFKDMKRKYSALEGHRIIYKCKADRESGVGKIAKAYDNFVLINFEYYGVDYIGKLGKTSVNYSSLLCNHVILEVEH